MTKPTQSERHLTSVVFVLVNGGSSPASFFTGRRMASTRHIINHSYQRFLSFPWYVLLRSSCKCWSICFIIWRKYASTFYCLFLRVLAFYFSVRSVHQTWSADQISLSWTFIYLRMASSSEAIASELQEVGEKCLWIQEDIQ